MTRLMYISNEFLMATPEEKSNEEVIQKYLSRLKTLEEKQQFLDIVTKETKEAK